VFSYPSLAVKLSQVILASRNSPVTDAAHEIFRALSHSALEETSKHYQDTLSSLGFSGLLEVGSFSTSKEMVDKKTLSACDMIDAVLATIF
jgi:hypothetical protein